MGACTQFACTGHLGKFSSCRDEALYDIMLDDTSTTTGDSDFEGNLSLIVLEAPESVALPGRGLVTVPAGAYLLHVACSGFVNVSMETDEQTARLAYEEFDTRYLKWELEDY